MPILSCLIFLIPSCPLSRSHPIFCCSLHLACQLWWNNETHFSKTCRKKGEREGGVMVWERQKPERAESVKEWYKTNKALFSWRGACVVQMEVILLFLFGGEFGFGVWAQTWHEEMSGYNQTGEGNPGGGCQHQAGELKSFLHTFLLISVLHCISLSLSSCIFLCLALWAYGLMSKCPLTSSSLTWDSHAAGLLTNHLISYHHIDCHNRK